MEGAGKCSPPIRRALLLIAIALISIQYTDAQCPVANIIADSLATDDRGSKTSWFPGDVVTYTCTAGNQVVVSAGTGSVTNTYTRQCVSTTFGAANPGMCEAIKCRTIPPAQTNAAANPNTNNQALNTLTTYTCAGSNQISGGGTTFQFTCQLKTNPTYEAEWVYTGSGAVPVCTAPACSATVPADSNVVTGATPTGTTEGSTVTYTCTAGFQVVPASGTTPLNTYTRTCTSGAWANPSPNSCSAVQCLADPPADSYAPAPTVTLPAALATEVTYTCNTNFQVGPNDPSYVRICERSATSTYTAVWALKTGEPSTAACVAITCSAASIPADQFGTVDTPITTSVGSTVTITCNANYQVKPTTGTTPTQTYTRTCTTAGWGAATPAVCSATACLTVPPTESNAPAPSGLTLPIAAYTEYTYTCNSNFAVSVSTAGVIDNNYIKVCQITAGRTYEATWVLKSTEPSGASCQAYNCATAPVARTNAATFSVSIANGGETTYTCDANNQYASGTSPNIVVAQTFKITCTSNAWPTTPAGCTPTACQTLPPSDSNAPAPSITVPAAAATRYTYTCNSNYIVALNSAGTPDSDYVRVCQITSGTTYQASWVLEPTEPSGAACLAYSCPSTAPSRANAVAGAINIATTSVIYTCNSNYEYRSGNTVSQTFTLTCVSNAWPSSPTGCTYRTLRGWQIALIVIAVLLVVGGCMLVCCLCWWYRRNRADDWSDRRQLQVEQQNGYPAAGMGGMGPMPPPPNYRYAIDTKRSLERSRYNGRKYDKNMYGSNPDSYIYGPDPRF